MRSVLVAILCVALGQCAFGAVLPQSAKQEVLPYAFEPEIILIWNCVISYLGEHYQEVNIPEISLNFDEIELGDIRGFLNINDVWASDPSKASLDGLVGTITILPPAFILTGVATFHDIAVSTPQYSGDFTVDVLHLFGEGTLNVRATDAEINFSARYSLLTGAFTDVNVRIDVLGDSEGAITGYATPEENDRVTAIINDLGPWARENQAQITAIVSRYVLLILTGQFNSEDGGDEGGDSIWDIIQDYCPI